MRRSGWWVLAACCAWLEHASGVSLARAEAVVPGVQAARFQGAEAGAVLMAELNCTACHVTEAPLGNQLKTRRAPNLDGVGSRTTPEWLRAFLEQPHRTKRGTTMPDMLQAFPAQERGRIVERLVHFLMSLESAPQRDAPVAPSDAIMEQGRQLYHGIGCVACHAPFDTPSDLAKPLKAGQRLGPPVATLSPSVSLGDLSVKTTVHDLARFLRDPLKTRPAGRMPSLNLTERESLAIAMYLLRDQAIVNTGQPVRRLPGLGYQYYEGNFAEEPPDFTKLVPLATGSAPGFVLDLRQRDTQFAVKFSGSLTLTNEGAYSFFTDSDDGSQLIVGSTLAVTNDGLHAATEAKGTIKLEKGEHPITVTYFNAGGESSLKVSYEGPGIPKREIPVNLLSHLSIPMAPPSKSRFKFDQERSESGREIFTKVGCAQCHTLRNAAPTAAFATPLNRIADTRQGCLAAQPPLRSARYDLSESQRVALAAALSSKHGLESARPPASQLRFSLAALNCYACHARDGLGGPDGDRLEYFKTAGELDLGDEGRIPPPLTGTGSKLRVEMMRAVLTKNATARPYMKTRMPQFGDDQVAGFLSAFSLADAAFGPSDPPPQTPAMAKHGRKLAGSAGFSCIACHNVDGRKSLGIPAIDMVLMAPRLRFDWFRRYLLDPPSLRPGTRMPAFWPDGKSARPEVLGGDPDRQILALWAYLQAVSVTGVPEGLIQGKQELVPVGEPILYRNFIEGAGPRAIGVGYPEKVNLAFDADQVRLAMLWQGSFIDAARHQTGRGEGFEPPLGHHLISMPPAPAFAELAGPDTAWPAPPERNTEMRMLGYELDSARRPKFLYRYRTIEVEEHAVPMPGDIDQGFRRTLTLRGSASGKHLWFRLITARQLARQDDGSWLSDGRIRHTLTLPPTVKPVLRKTPAGQMELILPIPENNNPTLFVEEIQW